MYDAKNRPVLRSTKASLSSLSHVIPMGMTNCQWPPSSWLTATPPSDTIDWGPGSQNGGGGDSGRLGEIWGWVSRQTVPSVVGSVGVPAGTNIRAPVVVTSTLPSEPAKPVKSAHGIGPPRGWCLSTAPPAWWATAGRETSQPGGVVGVGAAPDADTTP